MTIVTHVHENVGRPLYLLLLHSLILRRYWLRQPAGSTWQNEKTHKMRAYAFHIRVAASKGQGRLRWRKVGDSSALRRRELLVSVQGFGWQRQTALWWAEVRVSPAQRRKEWQAATDKIALPDA